jgi:flagellar biogenesis protein FliO
MKLETDVGISGTEAGGLAGWLLDKLRRGTRPQPRLALLERIALAPRQSLALVEADGRRLLVATSPEGAPVFYALDSPVRHASGAPSEEQPNQEQPSQEHQVEAPRPAIRKARRSTQRAAGRTAGARRVRAAW